MAASSGNDRSDPPSAAKDHDPWDSLSLLSHQYESEGNQKRWGSGVREMDENDCDAWDGPPTRAVHTNRCGSLPDPPAQVGDEDSWIREMDENRWAFLPDPPAQAADEDWWKTWLDPANRWASLSDPPAQADGWQNWVNETEWEAWAEPPVLPSTSGESVAIYKTKLINFLGRSTPIILQNKNGPCPLIAICNVLLLRGEMDLGEVAVDITHENLVSLLAERIIMESSSNIWEEEDITNALDIVPNLVKGLDVNVNFTMIEDFEFASECAIFDVLDIRLCHGWIVDPQDTDTVKAIGWDSYNTLVDKVVAFEMGKIDEEEDKGAVDREKLEQWMRLLTLSRTDINCSSIPASLDNIKDTPRPGSVSSSENPVAQVSDRDEKSHQPEVDCSVIPMVQQKGQLIKHFLENNASQLTYYGLFCLQEGLGELELCVFFRNNHFSTMFKLKGELYVLATDQGYIDKPDLVWEKLNEINGDTVFVNANFVECKNENQLNHSGTEQSSMTSTNDYLTTLKDSSPSASPLSYLDALEHHKPFHQ